jgi:CheY-like chemotaxis protein/HPt (histidine-containing phosphotransfer) domain-containing protein
LGARAGQKELELLCRIDPTIPDQVIGDAVRVGQILVNLVGNAIKFTEQGEIEVEIAPASVAPDRLVLDFTVRDTGIGIPTAYRNRIFESFSQVDASTTRRFGGTGLGLAISAQLVHLMGGKIWIDQQNDSGTTFHFTAKLGLSESQPSPWRMVEDSQIFALVADPNPKSLRNLREMLDAGGIATRCVDTQQAAIREAEAAADSGHPIQILMVDSDLPSPSGFDLPSSTQSNSNLVQCQTIVLTKSVNAGDALRYRRLGVARYLQKPVVQSELLNTIYQLTNREPSRHRDSAEPTESTFTRPLKVLLAEDGIVNQQVAIGLLKRRGHEVTVAKDGQEAIDAIEQDNFDAVLMDVQMPNMDGLEATRIIRRREQGLGRHLPIVAMTAGAMKGDEERCLASGMDGYISKPINATMLYETIERLAGKQSPIDAKGERALLAPPAESPPEPQPLALDLDGVRRLCGDSSDRFRVLAQTLLDESANLMEKIAVAVDGDQLDALHRHAHSLKGAASVFGATRVVDAAMRMEVTPRDPETIRILHEELQVEVAQMAGELRRLIEPRP